MPVTRYKGLEIRGFTMNITRRCRIGLLGCGTVGRGLVELVNRHHSLILERSGVDLSFTKILVRNLHRERPGVDRSLLTLRPDDVINDGCDIVVELIGGIEPARNFIRQALDKRKHVVTANKALLALNGTDLLRTAADRGVQFAFEASVCAGIPVVRALQNGLVGNSIESISGILNGTCNFILSRMAEGMQFEQALRHAQEKGFAEADPSLDIDGHDAAQKLKILSELAFGGTIPLDSIQVEGIRDITSDDVSTAMKSGYVIKHIAAAEMNGHSVSLRVQPMLIPFDHQLASVRDESNAVLIRGDAVGEMGFQGKGAGSLPSASAVLADIVEIASAKRSELRPSKRSIESTAVDRETRSYVRFTVEKGTGSAPITTTLENQGVSVREPATVTAASGSRMEQVRIFTNACMGARLQAALRLMTSAGLLSGKTVVLRVAS